MQNTRTALALAAAVLSAPAMAQTAGVVDWNPDGVSGTLGSIAVSIVPMPTVHWGATAAPVLLTGTRVADSYSAPWFSGPVSHDEALSFDVAAGRSMPYRLVFSEPVHNVRLNLASFASRLFTVQEGLLKVGAIESGQSSLRPCRFDRCIEGEASDGMTPNDSNGTVLLQGPVQNFLHFEFASRLAISDGITLQISAQPLAAPVPEPAAWALLLAGGLPLWLAARRRPRR